MVYERALTNLELASCLGVLNETLYKTALTLDPPQFLEWLFYVVRGVRTNQDLGDASDLNELSYKLGSLWAHYIVTTLHWELIWFSTGEIAGVALTNQARQIVCFPFNVALETLLGAVDDDNSLVLYYNYFSQLDEICDFRNSHYQVIS